MNNEKIWLAAPHMSAEGFEQHYVSEAFRRNWITTLGENVTGFEADLKEYSGANHVTALSSGTAALHLATLLAGVTPGGQVFCQDLTFAASANPALYEHGEPVFIDSEKDSWNMDPAALERAFAEYGTPQAVIVVDLYGTPAKLDKIAALCARHNVPLIEDAAEALGSTYKGLPCGRYGQYGVWSFNGNKIITTSGGGALVTRTGEDAAHALKLATQARENAPWYEHTEIGYNYRLSNVCAGIGRGQMKVLKDRVEGKREIFDRYRTLLADLPLSFPEEPEGAYSNRWLSVALLDEGYPLSPSDVITALGRENIECRHVWKPMHLQPVFRSCSFVTAAERPVSEDLFARGICLPSGTGMTRDEQERVCHALRRLFEVRA